MRRACIALLLCTCSAPPQQDEGRVQVRVTAQTAASLITRVSITVSPAGLTTDLTQVSGPTFAGRITVPAGVQQTVTANAYAGASVVGVGSGSITVAKGDTQALAILALDVTGPAPGPDHSPVVTSLTASATAVPVGGQALLTATAFDADADAITYAWSASPAGCGTFDAPASSSTNLTLAALGTCTVTLTATARGLSGSGSIDIHVGNGFPLRHSADNHSLIDQFGRPFPILGRASWFITSLDRSEYPGYVADTLAKGFTAIEFHVINHDPRGNDPPFGSEGTLLPFTNTLGGATWTGALTYGSDSEVPDFTKPDPGYWAYVDEIVSYCESNGILLLMFPAYVGFGGGDQGWMHEMSVNGAGNMRTYGAFVADRYKNDANIIWMMGGDEGSYSGAAFDAEQAMIQGLKSVAGQQSVEFSAEWSSESICTDQLEFAGNCTLQGAYSFLGDVNHYARYAYWQTPTMPAFLLEEPYDEEGPDGTDVNPAATQPVRRYEWWGWLGGIEGYVAGNGYVWPFNPREWSLPAHLNSPGAQDISRLNGFIRSIEWWKLVPSDLNGMRLLITAGGGGGESAPDYVAAAADPAGSILVAYVPPAHSGSFTVDTTGMPATLRARWFDPTTAGYTPISTGPNTGSGTFAVPAALHADGTDDWVLVIDRG